MAEQLPDLAGQTIGEYQIIAKLGVGGMGVVYEGKHPLIGKRVAVKVLLPSLSNEEELVQRFLSEARAVNEIRHRGIVDIFSFGKLPNGSHYFVMELLQGEPFDRLIKRRGALPLGETLQWTEEVLDALEAAHSAGIIHRDIKPSNLFLVDTGRGRPYVKLLDFGIAKLGVLEGEATPQTRASVIVGTPDYISPEQARGKAISPRTDLYALGVVIFEMLTGKRPFKGENSLQTMWMHVEAEPPRPSSLQAGIPPELDDLVLWALQKDQDNRPPSAAIMKEHVEALRATLIAETPTTPASGRFNTLGTPPPTSSRGLSRPATPPPGSGRQPALGKTPAPKSGRQSSVSLRDAAVGPPPPPSPSAPQPTNLTPLAAPTMAAPVTGLSLPAEPTAVAPAHVPDEHQPEQEAAAEGAARPSKAPYVILAVALVVLIGGGSFLLFGGDSSGKDAKPATVKPADVKPAEVKPAEVKPAEVKPADVKPADVKPADVKPADVKPAEVKPADVKPAEVKPADVKPADVKPADVKPAQKGITKQALEARLHKLQSKLQAKEAETGDQDRVLRQFLAQAQRDIEAAASEQDRREAWKELDELAGQLPR